MLSTANGRQHPKRKLVDAVDVLRPIYFVHDLRLRAKANSMYSLAAALLKEEGSVASPEHIDKMRLLIDQFSGYSLGRHAPGPRFVARVEHCFHGVMTVLNHVFWDAIRPGDLNAKDIELMLQRLHPSVGRLLWTTRSDGLLNSRVVKWDVARFRGLERRASLDALACAVIMIRKAQLASSQPGAFAWSRTARRLMLILGQDLVERGIAGPLAEHFEATLFSKCEWQGTRYQFSAPGYLGLVEKLAGLVADLESTHGVAKANQQRVDLAVRILNSRLLSNERDDTCWIHLAAIVEHAQP